MDISEAIMWGQYSVLTIMLVCGPVLLAAMAVGFSISLMQAVTQIQEMTLVFVQDSGPGKRPLATPAGQDGRGVSIVGS